MGEVEKGRGTLRPCDKTNGGNKKSSFHGLVPQNERRDERLGRLQEAAGRNT